MNYISKARLTAPKAVAGEIIRSELVSSVLQSNKQLTYIQAGAGYGKTTLLSEIANASKNVVWLTLDGESEILLFTRILTEALSFRFPDFTFLSSEYLLLENKENYITLLANAFISAIERIAEDFVMIVDDLHTIKNAQIKKFVVCLIKYKPGHVHLCFSSREAIWPELLPLQVRGNILELTQNELRFTRDEVSRVFGFFDEHVYKSTEGWPLAIGSYKVLLESGASLEDIVIQANDDLHAYLFYECLSRLPSGTVSFLKTTACFRALDVQMLDAVLGLKNTKLILESLVKRNIFTIKTSSGQYRYHPLFREYLKEGAKSPEMFAFLNKAAFYYYHQKQYDDAAENAILSGNNELLQDIILAGHKDYINSGNFDHLRTWFNALDHTEVLLRHEVLVAKGAFLSSIGNFSEAKACLDLVIPLLDESNKELYLEAMIHKARVLRNFVSFQESNELLDELEAKIEGCSMAVLYKVVIEKFYNLCWNSQIREAYALANTYIERCARAGDTRTKAWFERYLTAIHFFAGRMKDAVCFYEKSLALPEQEQLFLDLHSIGMYAAKAYQLMGDENKAISLITMELHKLRSAGRYEEMWAAYLLAAEIHYHAVSVNRANGSSESYEKSIKYFTLADEYAPLYRQTEFQKLYAKMYRLTCSIMFSDEAKEPYIKVILANLDRIGDYLKTLILGRLFGYYAVAGDFKKAVKYARMSIETGEKSDLMLIASVAYAVLAKAAIAMNDHPQALLFTKRFMELLRDKGVYDYLRMRQSYGPLLEFALGNNITPDFTNKMLIFGGYKFKKAYISTMGEFSVSPYKKREEPIKLRTKKERELLAFLLDQDTEGATKDRISEAIWSDSVSDNVKKLIGVNLAHIKKDLAKLAIENPIINFNKHYRICKDEIEYDAALLETAIKEFENDRSSEAAQKILTLYKGEYLADFEALWATKKRIKYRAAYEAALKHCMK